MKRVMAIVLLLVLTASTVCSCMFRAPELGKWTCTIPLTQDSMLSGDYDSLMTALMTGGNGVELIVKIKNGGKFSMDLNTDKLRDAVKKATESMFSIVLGIIGFGGDVSGLVDNVVDAAFTEAMNEIELIKSGTYTKEGDILTCNEEPSIRFKLVDRDELHLLDEDGSTLYVLTK